MATRSSTLLRSCCRRVCSGFRERQLAFLNPFQKTVRKGRRDFEGNQGGPVKTVEFSIIAFLITAGVLAATGRPFDLNNIRPSAIPQKNNTGIEPTALVSHLDLRAYGAYATYSSTTAKTTSGSAVVTLAAASDFRNNEFI